MPTGTHDDTQARERQARDQRALLQEYAGTLAHELATPLAVIQTASETALHLGDRASSDQHRELLETIRRNSRLAVLMLGSLGLARGIEDGTVALASTQVDLATLVSETVEDLREPVLRGHKVTVVVAASPPVMADETALREILFNLLTNAAKYSEPGADIEMRVDATTTSVVLAVRNHGSGVTPGDTERIFEKYLQLDADRPGSGLGLFVSRGLARAHGGDLTLQPAADRGSEFELRLPLTGGAGGIRPQQGS